MARLGDLYAITSGGTPSRQHSEYYDNGVIPWVKTGDLQGKYLFETSEKITQTGLSNSSARIYPPGTVLLAMYGATIGACSILMIEAATNQACAAFVKREDVLPEFLYAFLESKRQIFVKDGVGGAQPNISAGYLKNVDFPLFSIDQQQKISKILHRVDTLIALRKQQLAKLDELVKARFVEMFGLPVSNTKGWTAKTLKEVAPVVNYSGEFDDEVWLLNLDMVEAQTGKILGYLMVPKTEVGNSTCTFDTSNVLYSKLRPYLNKVVIPTKKGYATSELVPLRPVESEINREYLAHMLRSDEFVNMINEKVAGAKMPRVSMDDFRQFRVPLPPLDLQNQFAAFVQRVDKSRLTIQQGLDKLEVLKKALMQQYFG